MKDFTLTSLPPTSLFSSLLSQTFSLLSVPHISLYHRSVCSQYCAEHHWGLQTHHLLRHSNYLALLLLNVLVTVGLRGVKYLFPTTKFLRRDSTAASCSKHCFPNLPEVLRRRTQAFRNCQS